MQSLWRLLGLASRSDMEMWETRQNEHAQLIEQKIESSEKRIKEFITQHHASFLRQVEQLEGRLMEQEVMLEGIGQQLLAVPEVQRHLNQLQDGLQTVQQEVEVTMAKRDKKYSADAAFQKKAAEALVQQVKDLQASMQTIQEMVKITWIHDVIRDVEETYGLDEGRRK